MWSRAPGAFEVARVQSTFAAIRYTGMMTRSRGLKAAVSAKKVVGWRNDLTTPSEDR
jgi:hypothetical protein